jgi:hypothetical protein
VAARGNRHCLCVVRPRRGSEWRILGAAREGDGTPAGRLRCGGGGGGSCLFIVDDGGQGRRARIATAMHDDDDCIRGN